MGRRITSSILSILALMGLAAERASAQCGGLCLYEVGTYDMATSAAGAGARAQSPGTALFNPAGMTRLDDTHVHIGMANAIGSLEFKVSDRTEPNPPPPPVLGPFAGFNGGDNIGTYLPLAGTFATHEVTDRLRVGFAFAGMWGGAADYDNDWAGRTFVTDSNLTAFALQPAVAFRVTDWLSVGGAVGATYATFDLEFRTSLDANAPTAQINDADDWGVFGSLGLLFEPSESTRIGVYWRSETALTLEGRVDLPTTLPVGDIDFEGEMNFPQGVNVSVYHDINDQWAILGDAGWTDWSQFGYMPATLNSQVTIPIDRNWQDTWRVAAGVHYRPREWVRVGAGFSYDSSPVKASRRLPDIPVGEGYRFSTGLGFRVASNIHLGLTYTFLWFGGMEIDQLALPPIETVILDGKYDPGHMHFVGIHVTFSFHVGASPSS